MSTRARAPFYADERVRLYVGDVREVLRELPDESVHMCVTSPPYWGLRDYGTATWEGGEPGCAHVRREPTQNLAASAASVRGGAQKVADCRAGEIYGGICGHCGARRIDQQIGLEATPEDYVATMVEVFREVRRVLREDATLWLNLGDSYAGGGGYSPDSPSNAPEAQRARGLAVGHGAFGSQVNGARIKGQRAPLGLKPKDLVGIPWRVAFALQADGWWLRSDIVWSKANAMPESVTDRPTKAHEYIFLMSKSATYFYDAIAIQERSAFPDGPNSPESIKSPYGQGFTRKALLRLNGEGHYPPNRTDSGGVGAPGQFRNKRSVWTVATVPFPEAHFATFPPDLIKPCILAGTSERGCCATCGAPWERTIESSGNGGWTAVYVEENKATGIYGDSKSAVRSTRAHGADHPAARRTVGWQPTCAHDAPTVPGIVLDPFAGAGTTLYVAKELGRRAIGIELNPAYAAMTPPRVAQGVLL